MLVSTYGMKDYASYGVEDFVTDESYLRYYFKEDETDIQFWTNWIQLHPEKLDVIISANNYIDAFAVRLSESEFQKEQQRFTEALQALSPHNTTAQPDSRQENETVPFAIPEKHSLRRLKAEIIVAAATLLIVTSSVLYIASKKGNIHTGAPVAMIEKYVPKGERATITLPDGSAVELNADSKLTYPATFGACREVQLSGEAFFNIKQDNKHPFHVNSANLVITVLGTSFNMQCYPGQMQAKVALVTGKVKVNTSHSTASPKAIEQAVILNPFEMGVFSKADLQLQKQQFQLDEITGWRRGLVVFNNADFNEIADRLDKVYKIQLINQSHKTTFRFKGVFANTSAEEIIKSICLSKQLSYTINGNVITIH